MFISAFGLPADTELDFTMHLGRTGEVYFVTEVEEEVAGDLEGKGAWWRSKGLFGPFWVTMCCCKLRVSGGRSPVGH